MSCHAPTVAFNLAGKYFASEHLVVDALNLENSNGFLHALVICQWIIVKL